MLDDAPVRFHRTAAVSTWSPAENITMETPLDLVTPSIDYETVLTVVCMGCNTILKRKEGHGTTGDTAGICAPCVQRLYPEQYPEWVKYQLSNE